MDLCRIAIAVSVPCTLLMAAEGAAQTPSAHLVGPADPSPFAAPPARTLPQFRMSPGDLRAPGEPRRNGLIATYPLRDNLHVAVGRFLVPAIARPRTHMERDRAPAGTRPRDRGVAAIGFSLRF